MACRTELFAKSFFPSAVSLWDDLPEHIISPLLFKSSVLRTFLEIFVGNRKYSIYHARIRYISSNLDSDLFTNHISLNPGCTCGHPLEVAFSIPRVMGAAVTSGRICFRSMHNRKYTALHPR